MEPNTRWELKENKASWVLVKNDNESYEAALTGKQSKQKRRFQRVRENKNKHTASHVPVNFYTFSIHFCHTV